jgi:hypothetical protein
MGIKFEFKYYLQLLFAPRIKVCSTDNTPILYDNYNKKEYYIVLNHNKINIYSIYEVEKFIENKIDPMTRQKIKHYKIVKIKF